MLDDLPHAEASLTCRGCGYEVYFNHGGDGTAVYSCEKCGEIYTPRIVPFYFRNPACPGCGREFRKDDRIRTAHMRPTVDTIPCPRCKCDRMDLNYHMDILFAVEGVVPAIGQIVHAYVDRKFSIYPECHLTIAHAWPMHLTRLRRGITGFGLSQYRWGT